MKLSRSSASAGDSNQRELGKSEGGPRGSGRSMRSTGTWREAPSALKSSVGMISAVLKLQCGSGAAERLRTAVLDMSFVVTFVVMRRRRGEARVAEISTASSPPLLGMKPGGINARHMSAISRTPIVQVRVRFPRPICIRLICRRFAGDYVTNRLCCAKEWV